MPTDSVTLYVNPRAPKGLAHNLLPTAGETLCMMFRCYRPKEAFYNKAFKPAGVELND